MNETSPPKAVNRSAFPAVPLVIARSALFGAGKGGDKLPHHRVDVQDPRGGGLFYKGPRLTQYHALAWQAVIRTAQLRKARSGEFFEASADRLLRAAGCLGGDTAQRVRLRAWLDDLTQGEVTVFGPGQNFNGPLVQQVARHDKTGQLAIMLKPGLGALLVDEVLRNDLDRKARLGQNMMAMWLHDYFATHQRPQRESIDRLREVSGSRLGLPQFRQRLPAALTLLRKGEEPLVVSWSIDRDDRLLVVKNASRVIILKPEIAVAKQRGQQAQERRAAAILREIKQSTSLKM